jgi:hypothetical protein
MKVSELREIAPLADVYELKPDARYIIFCYHGVFSDGFMEELVKAAGNNSVLFTIPSLTDVPKMFELEGA